MRKLADIIVESVKRTKFGGDGRPQFFFKKFKEEKIDVSAAMVQAGYSKRYAETKRPLKKKTFHELLAQRITNDEILNVQKGNMEAKTLQPVLVTNGLTKEEAQEIAEAVGGNFAMFGPSTKVGKNAFFIMPYHKIRDTSLDKLYKLAGIYAPEKHAVVTREFGALTDEQLAEKMATAEARFKK